MISIIDYGVGNLFSLKSSLNSIGAEAVITSNKADIHNSDRIILPGVGAFSDAVFKLKECGLDEIVKCEAKAGKPLLGICLGMQLLFEKSYEYGEYDGLGLISGKIVPMKGVVSPELKVPHIGWNSLIFKRRSELFKYINDGDYVYFVHSYFADDCGDSVIAAAEYSSELTAAVQKDNIFGCQFHPEKSGNVGLNILKAFCETGGIL